MTDKQINQRIAEACGWKLKSNGLNPMWSWQNESLTHRIKWVANKEMASQGVLPNYVNDLNAMHEVQKVLTNTQWGVYVNYLTATTKHDYRRACAEASARQKAEAFLKTFGEWEEEAEECLQDFLDSFSIC